MKKKLIFLSLGLLFIGCATVDQNIKARTALSKCKYDIEKVEFDRLVISDNIVVDGNNIKDIKSAAITLLTNVLPKLIAKNFELTIDKAFFNGYISIENTTENEVALDRFVAEVFLDTNKILEFQHGQFKKIKPKQKEIEKLSIEVPFDNIKLKKPEKIGLKVTFYMSIMIGSLTIKDAFKITVSKDFPIPYDRINSIIDSAKSKIVDTVKERVEKESEKKTLEKVKTLIR